MISENIYTDRIPYTYIIKCVPEGIYYYGVRYAKNCSPSDLWVTYFTSSKYVKNLIDKYGKECFIFEIRKIFNDELSARSWESTVLRRMNVVTRSDFINKTDNKSISPELCGHNKGKTGDLCHRYRVKNKFLSEYNSKKTGDLNHMFGRTGEAAPRYGIVGDKHPNFGKTNSKLSDNNTLVLTCPHCNFTGKGIGNMKRWHFNNSKHNI